VPVFSVYRSGFQMEMMRSCPRHYSVMHLGLNVANCEPYMHAKFFTIPALDAWWGDIQSCGTGISCWKWRCVADPRVNKPLSWHLRVQAIHSDKSCSKYPFPMRQMSGPKIPTYTLRPEGSRAYNILNVWPQDVFFAKRSCW